MPASFWAIYTAKLLFAAMVLAVLYLAGLALKRVRPFAGSRAMKLLASIWLSRQSALHLVQVGRRYFLIGSGAEVGVLAELAAPDVAEELKR